MLASVVSMVAEWKGIDGILFFEIMVQYLNIILNNVLHTVVVLPVIYYILYPRFLQIQKWLDSFVFLVFPLVAQRLPSAGFRLSGFAGPCLLQRVRSCRVVTTRLYACGMLNKRLVCKHFTTARRASHAPVLQKET